MQDFFHFCHSHMLATKMQFQNQHYTWPFVQLCEQTSHVNKFTVSKNGSMKLQKFCLNLLGTTESWQFRLKFQQCAIYYSKFH